MKKIKLLSIWAVLFAALSFTSCNTDSNEGYQWPTQQEATSMLTQIVGTHNAGLLLPGSTDNTSESEKFSKDSVSLDVTVRPADSIVYIRNFPVSKLAKYIKDESIKKAVESQPDQALSIKLIPYSYTSLMFLTTTNDISFENEEGKTINIKFYTGFTQYATAYIGTKKATNTKCFLQYITPGMITVDGKENSGALKTYSAQGYYLPYFTILEFAI